jgi:uncharacterized Zn-finger protein
VDDSGGFASVAAQFLESIADDYTNTPVMLYCVRNPDPYGSSRNQRETIIRSLHDAVSLSKLSYSCNLMVPIGLPSLSMLPIAYNLLHRLPYNLLFSYPFPIVACLYVQIPSKYTLNS